MKKLVILGAAAAVVASVTMSATAATPVPFPAPTVQQVFVAAQTVTTDGALSSWFKPGDTVVFRAYAIDPKSKKVVDPKAVKYFYVTIPNEPNVKLAYGANAPGASTGLPWTGTWTVPATYPTGLVNFKVLIQIKQNSGKQLKGQFVQMPVVPSQLNISPTAPSAFTPSVPAGPAGSGSGSALAASLYVDTVAGTGPVGVAKRPVGCSQANVFKRGEQVVVRSWGTDLATTDVLSNANVDTAHVSIAGVPDVTLNWGAHGTVYFWSAPWIIPATYPMGETTLHVVFNLLDGKTATYDYTINIIPS